MRHIKLYEDFSGENCIIFESALLLKIDEKTKSEIKGIYESNPEAVDYFPLSPDKLHVTLTSIKSCKEVKDKLKSGLPLVQMPNIVLGKTTFAERPETGKKSFVVSIENQVELLNFVNSVYEQLELTNPESDRYFHITIANNVENKKLPGFADPFGSIGDIKKEDFI